jgi:hypothetical protein
VPVLPVARELLSKTKWIASKGAAHIDAQIPPKAPKLLHAKEEETEKSLRSSSIRSPNRRWRKKSVQNGETPPSSLVLTTEPESVVDDASDGDRESRPPKPRSRIFDILHQKSSSHSHTHTVMSSEGSSDVRDTLFSLGNRSNVHIDKVSSSF